MVNKDENVNRYAVKEKKDRERERVRERERGWEREIETEKRQKYDRQREREREWKRESERERDRERYKETKNGDMKRLPNILCWQKCMSYRDTMYLKISFCTLLSNLIQWYCAIIYLYKGRL